MPKTVEVVDANAQAVEGITVSLDNGRSTADGRVSGTVSVAETVPAGAYTITVTETGNPKVHASATLTVSAAPTPELTASPTSVAQGGEAVKITGTGFHADAEVNATSAASA
ncbi:hypothetical protein AB0B15_17055 [Streptomyces sp. NPDC045456]|uniref:hypothetical protein n=1 Tax=unclassified Streptomyces TaxID=2593676 RepID=UPI00340096E2